MIQIFERFASWYHSHHPAWQPQEEFLVEFRRDYRPSWSDEHGQRHYSDDSQPPLEDDIPYGIGSMTINPEDLARRVQELDDEVWEE